MVDVDRTRDKDYWITEYQSRIEKQQKEISELKADCKAREAMSKIKFHEMVGTSKDAIENFNDMSDDRAIVWAAAKIAELTADCKAMAENILIHNVTHELSDLILLADEAKILMERYPLVGGCDDHRVLAYKMISQLVDCIKSAAKYREG